MNILTEGCTSPPELSGEDHPEHFARIKVVELDAHGLVHDLQSR